MCIKLTSIKFQCCDIQTKAHNGPLEVKARSRLCSVWIVDDIALF